MITLKELGALAGVSISTVSKAINNSTDISLETRLRIQRLAQENGYVPPRHISGAKSGAGPNIAMIYSDVTSNYYTRLIEIFDARIHEMGGFLIMSNASFQTARVNELLNYFQSIKSIAGVILVSALNIFGDLPQPGIPLVGISYPSFETHPFDYICVNDGVGIDEAVECLVSYGHRRIAFISEPFTQHRLDFFKTAMTRRGLPLDPALIRISQKRFNEAGYEAMKDILANGEPPTAVFAAYDDIAVGAAQAIREKGLAVPDDISLLGVDNTLQTVAYHKILASVDCHIEDQANIALGLLMKKINERDYSAVQNVSLHTNFIRRNTVGPARDAAVPAHAGGAQGVLPLAEQSL